MNELPFLQPDGQPAQGSGNGCFGKQALSLPLPGGPGGPEYQAIESINQNPKPDTQFQ